MRVPNIIGTVLLATTIGLVGCKKDKGEEGGKAAAGGGAGGGVTEADALTMLPADSTMVVSANINDLRKSKLWEKYGGQFEKEAYSDPDFKKFQSQCGFDPMKTASHIWIGGKAGQEKSIIAVINGLPKAKLLACAGKDASVKVEGEMLSTGKGIYVGFAGPNTAVMALGGKNPLEEALKKSGGLKANDKFKAMEGRLNKDSMWMALLEMPPGATRGMPVPVNINGMYMSGNVKSGVAVNAGLVLKDEQQVNMLSGIMGMGIGQLKNQLPDSLKGLVDKLKYKGEKEVLTFSVALSMGDVESIEKAAKDGSLPM